MSPTDKFGLIILGLTMGVQIVRRPLLSYYLRWAFSLAIAGAFGVSAYWTVLQYQIWKADPISKFLLPPHHGWDYFYSYAGQRIFAPWLISLLAAILISRLAEFFNRRFDERFFEKEEIALIRLGVFLTGYPGFLFYIVLMFVAGLSLSLIYSLLRRGRAPLYYFWLPMATVAILAVIWFIPESFLKLLAL